MKRSKLLLASAIIGSIYAVYITWHCISSLNIAVEVNDAIRSLGTFIGVGLILPHVFLVWLALIFNWCGWGTNNRGLVLADAILYCVSVLAMPIYFMFITLEVIFSFIGFAHLTKINEENHRRRPHMSHMDDNFDVNGRPTKASYMNMAANGSSYGVRIEGPDIMNYVLIGLLAIVVIGVAGVIIWGIRAGL